MDYIFEEVTTFSPDDAASVRALVQQLDSHYEVLTDTDYQSMIKASGTHLLVVRHPQTQKISGMVTLIVYRIPYKMKGQVEDLVVDESVRGQGIGKQLLLFALEKAKEYGVKSLNLTSRPTRESANNLYQSLGFEKRDTNVYRVDL